MSAFAWLLLLTYIWVFLVGWLTHKIIVGQQVNRTLANIDEMVRELRNIEGVMPDKEKGV